MKLRELVEKAERGLEEDKIEAAVEQIKTSISEIQSIKLALKRAEKKLDAMLDKEVDDIFYE